MGWWQRRKERRARRKREKVAARQRAIVGVRPNGEWDDINGICGECGREFGDYWLNVRWKCCPQCLSYTYRRGEFWIATDGTEPTHSDAIWFVQKQRREREQSTKPEQATVLDFFAEGG